MLLLEGALAFDDTGSEETRIGSEHHAWGLHGIMHEPYPGRVSHIVESSYDDRIHSESCDAPAQSTPSDDEAQKRCEV